MPIKDKFPYTIRVVSEITESNGSSSMATVCGTSLSLMDAGVPLEKPIAGIAMGLIKEKKNYAILSDILGDEDHLGDMDFKVAGTKDGITALQMDIKITSITKEIMEKALNQALDGRIKILSEMDKAISSSRKELNSNAPKIQIIKIDPSKIKDVIGSGGKIIKSITEETGVKIDIDDDGTIKIASTDSEGGKLALEKIENIVAEPELNEIYSGTVVKIMDFGAFVNFMGTKDGLVHISELSEKRVGKTTDIVKVGDKVKVKVIGFDNRGKIRLSMKELKQKSEKNFNRA
jgi:polyribonucleotide nucleotidyltransferase